MTQHPHADQPLGTGGRRPDVRARQAVGLAALGAAAVAFALAFFGVASAIGGDDAVSDNWAAVLVGVSGIGGFLASFAAFVVALVAKAKGEQGRRLLLPLALFPVLLAFVLLGEALWWE